MGELVIRYISDFECFVMRLLFIGLLTGLVLFVVGCFQATNLEIIVGGLLASFSGGIGLIMIRKMIKESNELNKD